MTQLATSGGHTCHSCTKTAITSSMRTALNVLMKDLDLISRIHRDALRVHSLVLIGEATRQATISSMMRSNIGKLMAQAFTLRL
jgi:hypothetical protein